MANADYTYAQVKAGNPSTAVYKKESAPFVVSAGVITLQTKLRALKKSSGGYYLTDSADGKFGANTETAVKSFQKDNYLTEDGIVGKDTINHLDIAYSDRDNYNVYGSEISADYLLRGGIDPISIIARLIYAENTHVGTDYSFARNNIALVIYNRFRDKTGWFKLENDYITIARSKGEWTVITGSGGPHPNALKPHRTSGAWQHALALAKKLINNTNLPSSLSASTGMSWQLYATKVGSESNDAINIVRIGGTACFNRPGDRG